MNVTFSKNSWHYKFNYWIGCSDFFGWSAHCTREVNLCNYFWKTVWNILLFIVQTIFSAATFLGLGYIMSTPVLYMFDLGVVGREINYDSIPYYWWWGWLAGYLFGFTVVVTICVVVASTDFCIKKVKETFCNQNDEQTSSLVVSWVKAKKSKFCPVINWKE